MLVSPAPQARVVMAPDGIRLATYEFGDEDSPVVLAIHGFASSGLLNWHASGWTRDLTRAGFRVIAFDQRGHGASDKPHDPAAYSLGILSTDALAVLDTFMVDEVVLVGYSLGSRVGWRTALDYPHRVSRAVLGGMPVGDPLTRFRLDQARAFVAEGSEIHDRLTATYMRMASGIPGNDATALIALVEGMRAGPHPDERNPPGQPLLFATGTDDEIIEGSRTLARAAPRGEFVEIPGRNHFTAPGSKVFRDAAIGFLTR